MNPILFNLALKLPDFRDKFGWTQDELSNRSGISRATIINIEKDPSRMTKTMALAILFVMLAELNKREKIVADRATLARKSAAEWIFILGLAAKGLRAFAPVQMLGAILGAALSSRAFFNFALTSKPVSNVGNEPPLGKDENSLILFQKQSQELLRQLRMEIEEKSGFPLNDLSEIVSIIERAEQEEPVK